MNSTGVRSIFFILNYLTNPSIFDIMNYNNFLLVALCIKARYFIFRIPLNIYIGIKHILGESVLNYHKNMLF